MKCYFLTSVAPVLSLLPVTGGKTRVLAGPKSEGESYFFVADHYDWWGKPDLRARASTEDFARDSFENLLFSICRCDVTSGFIAVHKKYAGLIFFFALSLTECIDTLQGCRRVFM